MDPKRKQELEQMKDGARAHVQLAVLDRSENGGRIRISSDIEDLMGRVFHQDGIDLAHYKANPVVQFGHNYREPWATIGRSTQVEKVPHNGGMAMEATFELRPPYSEADPQHIVRRLWSDNWIRTASVGLSPKREPGSMIWEADDDTGIETLHVKKSYLDEWSLVPVPANPEALRLAAGLDNAGLWTAGQLPVHKLMELLLALGPDERESVLGLLTPVEADQADPDDSTEPAGDDLTPENDGDNLLSDAVDRNADDDTQPQGQPLTAEQIGKLTEAVRGLNQALKGD